MEKQTKILIGLAAAGVVAFALWRNYKVKPTNGIVLDTPLGTDKDTSNEQKELIQKINNMEVIKDGDIIQTSFGKNIFKNGVWTKYAEVWQGFADDKTHPICPPGYKYVYFPLIKGFKEHLPDKNGGKCVENSLDITVEDDRIHPAPKLVV
jgi:hypothetical protein